MQNALVTLHKLSVVRRAQRVMLDCGLLPWLVQQLHETDNMPYSCVESCAALLMNLSMRSACRKACCQVRELCSIYHLAAELVHMATLLDHA